MKKAMIVLSGGQDSTTCLFWAKQRFGTIHAVTFDYGQRHSRELDAAKKVARLASVASHDIIHVPNLLRSRSPLVDSVAPLETYQDYESMDAIIGDRVELTFVPMRNAFFLTLAANIALSKECFDLVTGVCHMDNANYPDCRHDFISLQEKTINAALGIGNFHIHTPLINLSKAQSIKLAKGISGCMEALSHSYSCYAGTYPPCGVCHACVLRAYGFNQAKTVDPLLKRVANECT